MKHFIICSSLRDQGGVQLLGEMNKTSHVGFQDLSFPLKASPCVAECCVIFDRFIGYIYEVNQCSYLTIRNCSEMPVGLNHYPWKASTSTARVAISITGKD